MGNNELELDHAGVKKYLTDLPSSEPWLRDSPDAQVLFERGLAQAESVQGRYLGSFAKYADLEIEED